MRSKKIFTYFITTILMLVVIMLIAVFCISPVKQISSYSKSSSANANSDIIKNIENVEYNKESGNLNISFAVTEEELNNILYESMKNRIAIDGLESDINSNSIKIYINSYLLKVLPTQYMVELIPSLKDSTLILNLKNVKIGRIGIPKKYVLNKLKENSSNYISVNDDNSISINNEVVEPFKISSFNIEDSKLRVNLNYSIKSITDITNLFSNKMPKEVTDYIKNIFR